MDFTAGENSYIIVKFVPHLCQKKGEEFATNSMNKKVCPRKKGNNVMSL